MVTVNCKICGKEFNTIPARLKMGWGKYCSKKCQYKSMENRVLVKCEFCGKSIYRSTKSVRRSKSKLFFCRHLCQLNWFNKEKSGDKHPNWKNGEASYRDRLMRTDALKHCARCGMSDVRVLSVHHKDKNRLNNSFENLEWLCQNCHFLEHRY